MKKKFDLKVICCIFFIIVCFGGALYYSFQIIVWKNHIDENKNIESEIKKAVSVVELSIDSYTKDEVVQIDFDLLKSMNPDTVAYIQVFNTNIDYPVVQTSDNNYYLTHNFEKKWNIAGWVFADYKNKFDGTDQNIVLYAHNMMDGSMFGSLKDIFSEEWRKSAKDKTITFVTGSGTFSYQVFSTYEIEPEDYYIHTSFSDESLFASFLDTIKSRSSYVYDVDVSSKDRILTLSTCTIHGDKRVVLHAKLL